MEADCSYYSASMLPWDGLVVCVQCVRYCGGNGAHIQDTVLVGTALWSVYSVLGTVYCGGNGAHIQDTVLVGTALWSVYSVYCVLWWEWGPHTGHCAGGDGLVVCVQCVRYCGGNGTHIQDTVLVGTALWSVYSVYCVLWWEWGPHTGHCAGGDGLVVCVQCVRYCGGNGAHIQDTVLVGTALWSVYSVYCVLWWEWGPHTGHRAGGDGLVVCVQCVLCTVVGMGSTYRTLCWWGRPCGLCTVC